jgi:hypothetical protein
MYAATRQRFRLSGGTDLSLITAGEASEPAVLLLHGSPSSARMFREVIPELSQPAHVVAPEAAAASLMLDFIRRTQRERRTNRTA